MNYFIPIIKPDRFLAKTVGYVRFLFSRTAFIIYLLLGILGLHLVNKQWSQFIDTFQHLFTIQNILFFACAVFIVKFIHELAHAYVAKYYGCHVTSIGVAFIVFRPALYTDITDAWRVREKKHRLFISGAGIASELVVAVLSMLLWSFSPPGDIKTILFFIASFSWISSIFINLNPLFCFDGYYLLADYLEVPNLQDIAFDLAKWRLAEFLFMFGEEPPHYFDKTTQKWLLIFAYSAWFYRTLFFFAIAVV